MSRYFEFCKRGWWAFFLMFASNIAAFVFYIPLSLLFKEKVGVYWFASLVVTIVVVIPIWGWLFEKFAVKSDRLLSPEFPIAAKQEV